MKGLFLDDERYPNDVYWTSPYPNGISWKLARNYDEFEALISTNEYDLISFDHDLGETSKTGYDCVKLLVEMFLSEQLSKYPEVVVHSMNPVGAKNIRNYWESFLKYRGIR
jgi:hypothetical protein